MNGSKSCLQTNESVCGPLFFRPIRGGEGTTINGHIHNRDHVTIVCRGSVVVQFGCPCKPETYHQEIYKAGDYWLTKAEVKHAITMLEPDTLFYCMFAHYNEDGTPAQEWPHAGKPHMERNPAADPNFN